MSKQDKKKVQALQKNGGDELLVWKGDSKATHVYFDDIVNLIKEESIHSNLIDVYAELLHEQQEVVNPTSDEASLIFTSMCLKVIREYHPRKRSKHIDAHVKNYQGERYLLFPLHHEYHWTIVVYDAKDNLWKHYNSLRPRTSIHDPYIDQAQEIRKYIEHVVSVIGESSPLYTKLAGQNPTQPTKSVDVCPQQVDCGPAVCYIMRAHIYHEEIVGSLSSAKCECTHCLHDIITGNMNRGARLGNLYCDPLMTSVGHKISGRQRWTPTPVQLQILERLFDQGNGTPSKQKIKDITSDLSQHGQISKSNVYHWFQNRRARSKRKQHVAAPNNAESEVETEVESPDEKKTKPEDFQSQHNPAPRAEDLCFQNPEISSGMRSLDSKSNKGEPMFPSNGSSKPERSLGQISFYDSMLSNPRIDHLIGKMRASGTYNPYLQEDDYNMTS
ncbi:unnamed protein product [Camellia sinensis]